MKLVTTREEVRALMAFRRAPYYGALRRLLERELQAARARYLNSAPANERLRVALYHDKSLMTLLFEAELEIGNGQK